MRILMSTVILFLGSFQILSASNDEEKTDILAGHSYHGEAFNEGPRQKPYLMEGLGQSNFDFSTDNDEARFYFNQGIDQLHGFWYFEAERSFRHVAMMEPDCVMAYWGLAMANVNNEDRARKFLKEARSKMDSETGTITEREKMYVAALEAFYDEKTKEEKKRAEKFTKKLEELVLEYPNDIEAKAFLACQIWMNQRKGIKITSHVGINSILDDIFEQNPNHPAHHYRIHLWDYEKPEIALLSAAKCGPSLPDIAHMWHMPGHIYSRLKRYEDAVWQQEASARVDHRHMMHDWVLPDQIHNFAHNNEWCIRNLIHVGRVGDAIDLATNMLSLPRHPKYNTLEKRGSSRYGRQRLFQALSTFEQWDQLIETCESGLLVETDLPLEQIKRLRHLGRAYYRSGRVDEGGKILSDLEKLLTETKDARSKAESKAKLAVNKQTKLWKDFHEQVASVMPHQLQSKFKSNYENVLRRDHRKRTSDRIAKAIKKHDGEINVINRAIDELKGYQLVSENKYKEALKKLNKAGEVDAIYRAYVRHLAGETEKALEAARKHARNNKNQVQPLAMLTWLLWECDLKEEAVETFQKLAQTSASIDIQSSFFDRLKPVVEHVGAETAWQNESSTASDLGHRPNLDSLGPFRWQPVDAPDWELLDFDNQTVSMSQYSGRPVVVIFYLGHGCLHCAEQLQAFAPKMDEFLEAGIEMVAISTDQRDGLKKSIDSYGDVPLPIKLLANHKMDVFKQYHAFDEFEDQPLHGTFLIDGSGRIRWQDISYEPFMDPDFLLNESKRLLGHSVAR